MDPRTLELINLDLDGRLDQAARSELEQLLAVDPGARARQAELQAVARALAAAPAPELPQGFRDAVLAQLAQRTVRTQPSRLQQRFRQPRVWLALAASVAIAVVALRVVEQGSPGAQDQLSGTLAPASASVTVTPAAGGVRLAFDLPAGPRATLVIDVAGAAHAPLSASADAGLNAVVEGRRIVIRDVGAGRFTVGVQGDVAVHEVTARLVRDGNETQVTRRP